MDFNGIKDPMVRDYLMNKYGTNKSQDAQAGVDQANMMQGIASIGDVLVNSQQKPTIFHNRMEDLGKTPTIIEPEKQKTDVSGLQRQAQMKLDQARSDEDNAVKLAFEQRKAELAAEAAAKKAEEDARWRQKEFDQKEREMKLRGQSKQTDPLVDMMRVEQYQKLKREAKQDADALNVPGFDRTGEVYQSPAEAKEARDATGIAKNIQSGIETLKEQMKRNGNFEWGGSGGSAMNVTANDLRLQLKELNKLGVLNGPDLALMLQQIPDTESVGQLFTRNSTTDAQLQQVLDNIARKVETGMAARGYRPKGATATSTKPATVIQNGHTYTLNPQTGEYE
jgi:hypothetical protein